MLYQMKSPHDGVRAFAVYKKIGITKGETFFSWEKFPPETPFKNPLGEICGALPLHPTSL